MAHQRRWLAAAAIGIGIGAALAIGCGVAAADTGSSSSAAGPSRAAASSSHAHATKSATGPTTSGTLRAKTANASNVVAVEAISLGQPTTPRAQQRSQARSVAAMASARTARAEAAPGSSNGVTGVKVGHADLNIPVGPNGYTAPADWYLPTQADGSVTATGVIWLQHGFLADKSFYSTLATTLAQQTNSVVVAPTISSFPILCGDCSLNSAGMQQAVASMFLGDRAALNISANAAGFQGTLPEQFILTGHSAGGGFATAVAGYTVANGAAVDTDGHPLLLGVVMYDGVSSNGTFAPALAGLDTLDIPVYQIAAPPQAWNAFGMTTDQLLELRPGQFDGVVLAGGSHVDSALGSGFLIDLILQVVTQFSPPGNTAAVGTLATGWINDMYVGAGPSDPRFGLYGRPGQPIILGQAAATVLPTSTLA